MTWGHTVNEVTPSRIRSHVNPSNWSCLLSCLFPGPFCNLLVILSFIIFSIKSVLLLLDKICFCCLPSRSLTDTSHFFRLFSSVSPTSLMVPNTEEASNRCCTNALWTGFCGPHPLLQASISWHPSLRPQCRQLGHMADLGTPTSLSPAHCSKDFAFLLNRATPHPEAEAVFPLDQNL